MKLLTFKKGGIHPPENKHLSEKAPIQVVNPPELLFVPMGQHIGKPAKVLVKAGDAVKKGQLIGEADGFISANIHSPVSGKVKEVKSMPHPIVGKGMFVIIENDGQEEEVYMPPLDMGNVNSEDIVKRVHDAGIVGMVGATFPTKVKLSPPPEKQYDTLIINGAECEPYLTADHRLMLEYPEKVVKGTLLIQKAIGVKNVYIGIEENKEDAIEELKKHIEGTGIEIKVLKTKYPQGAEKQLIKAITDREVPAGGLPMDIGVCVHNVGTAAAIYDAVVEGKPLIERVVTVTGGVHTPSNFIARIGTPISTLVENAGGYKGEIDKLIMGGPMMGIALRDDSVPVMKGTSGIIAMLDVPKLDPYNCLRCAKCVDVCPMGLVPVIMADFIENFKYEESEKTGVLNCIECGSCAYVCPANRPLVHYFKTAKREIGRMKRK